MENALVGALSMLNSLYCFDSCFEFHQVSAWCLISSTCEQEPCYSSSLLQASQISLIWVGPVPKGNFKLFFFVLQNQVAAIFGMSLGIISKMKAI